MAKKHINRMPHMKTSQYVTRQRYTA